jgi:molecular chaperone GrpE
MSQKRRVWQEVSDLSERLRQQGYLDNTDVKALGQQLNKLGKVQFKANTLLEAQMEQQRQVLGAAQATIARQEEMITALSHSQQKDMEAARRELLLAILPVLDGLDAALANGRRQVTDLGEDGQAGSALTAWLDGLGLIYRRLLDVLAQFGVEPIQAVGHTFNPTQHVASGVDTGSHAPSGTIVAEHRRGYRSADGVLRFSEVIVSRLPSGALSEPSQQEKPLEDEPVDTPIAEAKTVA